MIPPVTPLRIAADYDFWGVHRILGINIEYPIKHPPLVKSQEVFVSKIIHELNSFDNLYS